MSDTAPSPEQNHSTVDAKGGVAAPSRPSAKRWVTPALALVAALALGVFGGVLIGHATGTATAPPRGDFPNASSRGQAGAGGGFTAGTIVSVAGSTITLKTAAGATVTVTTKSDTAVARTETTTVGSLAAGDTITVVGSTGSDGKIAASRITEGQTAGFGGGSNRPGTR